MSRSTCPICGASLVSTSGSPTADILIVTDAPDYEDVRLGRLMSGKAGDILRKELAVAGVQLAACEVVSLWPHGKSADCDVEQHLTTLAKRLDGRSYVILMGSEVSKALVGHGLMEITGLQVKSKLFPKVKFFGMPHPTSLMRGDVGEMRLALEKFTKLRTKRK